MIKFRRSRERKPERSMVYQVKVSTRFPWVRVKRYQHQMYIVDSSALRFIESPVINMKVSGNRPGKTDSTMFTYFMMTDLHKIDQKAIAKITNVT